MVTVAWKITFVWRHFPSSGQSGVFLQLQISGCCVVEFERTCLLCDEMINFMFLPRYKLLNETHFPKQPFRFYCQLLILTVNR